MALADLATPMAIRVAATLSLVEHAGEQGATAVQLAGKTGTVADGLGRLLDHLVTVGVFELDAQSGRYRPTSLGEQMAEDSSEGIKPLLDITCAGGRGELAFVDLLTTVTTGEPAYPHRYGRGFWADLEAEPKLRRSFDAQMNWRFRTEATQIATRFDWGRFPDILDVGGGNGQLLIEILRAHPGVSGRVLDLEPTATAAGEKFAVAGAQDRASAIAGSFFDPLPTGADAYVLSDILHDWDDEHARKILTECRRAAAPHGTVIVVDGIRGQSTGTAMNLFMLVCFAGRERTVEELCELAGECGLKLDNLTRVSDERTALEFKVVLDTADESPQDQ